MIVGDHQWLGGGRVVHDLNHFVKEVDTEPKGIICCSLQQSLWKKTCIRRRYSISLPQRAKGLALGEMRLAEDLTLELELNCAVAFLRCGKWAERKQNVTDFMSHGILYTLMQTLSFLSLYPCMKPHTCGLLCN